MARSDEAQKTLRVLAANSEAILEAHLNRGNCVLDSDANQSLIETLKHHRLVWRIDGDDEEDPRLNKDLVKLLNHITESDRRRWANEQVGNLWRELTDLFEQYKKARSNVSLDDQERLEAEIKECLHLLIEDIRHATETFAAYLNNGFSYITDIELRIHQNEKAIDRAGKLTSLFGSFNIQSLADQAGSDPFLKRLLLKYLPATLEEGRSNLSYALNQLTDMLVRLQEEQRLNRLIGGFEIHFQRNPGYVPSIEHIELDACPGVLNSVAPFYLGSSPDIYDPMDDEELKKLAAVARTLDGQEDRKPKAPLETGSIEYGVDGVAAQVPEDPMMTLIDDLIQYVLGGNLGTGGIRASDVLADSDLEMETPGWLASLVAELDALTPSDRARIHAIYHHDPDPLYPDNLHIHDLTLRQYHAG